jgi:hypothetical protein
MEQFSATENMINGNNETIEIRMNDVVSKDGYEVNPNVQTKTSRNPKKGNEEIMKKNLKNCMLKGKFGNHMV